MKLSFSHSAFRILHSAFFFAALIFASFTTASAQDVITDDQVNAVASKLYCPVCESTPLDVCPTDACKDWRELIRTMLSEGKSEAQILQHFEDQYGARVLAEPPKKDFYLLIYIIPPALILAGAFLLIRSMKDWTKPKAAAPVSQESAPAKDDYLSRFEDEVKKQK